MQKLMQVGIIYVVLCTFASEPYGCVRFMWMQVDSECMKPLIGPLLRAMHRLAKEHNQAPSLGLLSAKPDQPAG
jgi:hypothetical protein